MRPLNDAKFLLVLCLSAWIMPACCYHVAAEDSPSRDADAATTPPDLREFSPNLDGRWIGGGISYGPYRKGQSPGRDRPFPDEVLEDLNLLTPHWNLIRTYGSREVAEDVLKIIHERKLPVRVMLGAWITRESEVEGQGPAGAQAAKLSNRQEVMEVIRLANAYPDEVLAISVGNETQVFWSDHLTDPDVLIRHIRAVRGATTVPVTTADDFNFWNKPESQAVANEVDFIVTHIHAMWAGLKLTDAMAWTERIYAEVSENHPEKVVVIGEAGWATQVHNEGEQAKLIKGKAGEQEQQTYYRQFTEWARQKKICTFYFEAFDESWKGGPHVNEVEKHWGLFYENRKPKKALAESP